MKKKIPFDPDKRTWHPSPLLGQVVLATTLNPDGSSNVAPKSWVSMMAFEPPILALGCNFNHWTARNILKTDDFAINLPSADMAAAVWRCSELPHPRTVEAAGWTAQPALEIKPPLIQECVAHLECRHDHHISYGDEVIILGKIVAASIDEQALEMADPYEYLRPFVYLEKNTYGIIEEGQNIHW